VFGGEFIIMSTPGHTNEHISFYSPTFNSLFCGDTLFSGGCGRVFDGNYEDLFCSLKKFTNLRSETKVYCAHEYTINNLEFALKYTDNNKNIEARLEECKELITKQLPTVPSTIKIELDSNIFFFCHNKHKDIFAKEIKNAESMKRVDIFKYLREKKNNF
jgi:hydroxyacylglutathione hydrolase